MLGIFKKTGMKKDEKVIALDIINFIEKAWKDEKLSAEKGWKEVKPTKPTKEHFRSIEVYFKDGNSIVYDLSADEFAEYKFLKITKLGLPK